MALMISSGGAILSTTSAAPASKASRVCACSTVALITNTAEAGLASCSSLISSSPSPSGNPRSIIATSTPERLPRASASELARATTSISGSLPNKLTKRSRNLALSSTNRVRIIPLPRLRGTLPQRGMVSGVEGRHIPHMAYFLAESSLKFREFIFLGTWVNNGCCVYRERETPSGVTVSPDDPRSVPNVLCSCLYPGRCTGLGGTKLDCVGDFQPGTSSRY